MLRASVIVPTVNRLQSLAAALGSLERQSAPAGAFEVVVVLDGCTDGTEGWLRRYRPPFELRWCSQPNAGLAAARNRGAAEARLEVLLFLDDDVLATPDLVAAHLEAQAAGTELVVQGYMPMPRLWSRRAAALLYADSYEQTIAELVEGANGWHLWSGNFSVRRSTFERVGGFDAAGFRHYGGEDTDFGLRAVAGGATLVFEPRALAEHRQRDRSGAVLARQAFWEGVSRVSLARKHGLALAGFPGCAPSGRADRLVATAWSRPRLAEALGTLPVAALWLADRGPSPGLRLLAAKVVARYHRLGGVAVALSAAALPVEAATPAEPAAAWRGRAVL